MSTLVMVKRNGELCMGAETLGTWGPRKERAEYVARPEKILRVGDSYLGFVGWSVTRTVLESVFEEGLAMPELRSERELFEFSRQLHRKLKDEYFLNASAEGGEPFESSHLTLFVMSPHGLFGLHSLRTVEQYERFAAVGSGAHYALGAMYGAWEQGLPADEIARLGVEAGIEFDCYSLGPITLKRTKLEG